MVAIDMVARGRGNEALPSLQRLAIEDEAPAQYALGRIYLEGQWAPMDRARGVAWLQLVRDGYPGIVSRPLVLEEAKVLLENSLPRLPGPELIAADRLQTELVADWSSRWPLDLVAARVASSDGRPDAPAIATAANGRPLMAGCALDPQRHGCQLPKDFVATEHCSGAIQVTDKPATAISPDARLQPLPRSAPRGTASLNIYVDRSGFVCSSMIWKSSGDPDFDIAALEAVSLSRFAPGLRATNAVDSLLRFQITKRF